jgi:hypothetical protein
MTVAAILDAGVGSGAGAGSGTGAGSRLGTRGPGTYRPIAAAAGLGSGARAPGARGVGSGGACASGTRSGSALIATSAEQGVKSSGAASNLLSQNSSGLNLLGQLAASDGNFRSQWEAAVNAQSRGTGILAEEVSAGPAEIADGVRPKSSVEHADEAPLLPQNVAKANGVTVNAAGRTLASRQIEAMAWSAPESATESATQGEAATATAAMESKTRDGQTTKSAEHKLPAQATGAQAGAGDPAMLSMAAIEPAPIGSALQPPAQMITATEPAPRATTSVPARATPSNDGGGGASAIPNAISMPLAQPGESAETATNAQSGGTRTSINAAIPHAVATIFAPTDDSAEAAASFQGGGIRASVEIAAAQQSQPEVSAAGIAYDPVWSSHPYVNGEVTAAAQPEPQTQEAQSEIRSRAAVRSADSLGPAAAPEAVNTSGGEGSKGDVSGLDATPGRPKSTVAASAPAAIIHAAQAANLGSDQSGWVRVAGSGEGDTNLAARPAGASGSAVGQTAAGSAGGTFAALDAVSSVGTPGWIHASSQRAEAGFEDPVLGWVGVRADVVSGSVHAALLPGSADAAAVLSTHLAGLGTYLSEQHTTVSTLTMAAPGQQGMESGLGQNLQQNAQQNGGEDSKAAREQASGTTVSGMASRSGPAETSELIPVDSFGGMRGAHISVMA